MSGKIFYRRRAERFAQLLDEANGGRRHHVRSDLDEELAGLVALGKRVPAAVPVVEPDPDFRANLRAMLLATAEREGIGSATTAPPAGDGSRRATRRTARAVVSPAVRGQQVRARARGAIIIGVAAGAIAVSGMSAASENALPGDALYAMKRSTERAQLALTSSDLNRGRLYLEFARIRLAEAEAVRGDAFGFASVLDDMDRDTRQGVKLLTTAAVQRRDEMALDAINSFLVAQHRQVSTLRNATTRVERERAAVSLALLDSVRSRAEGLRAALLCGIDPMPVRADALGPLPLRCPDEGSSSVLPTLPAPTDQTGTGTRTPESPRAEQVLPENPARNSPTDGRSELHTKQEDVIEGGNGRLTD